jgi:superfamily II DNA/RNA helicase
VSTTASTTASRTASSYASKGQGIIFVGKKVDTEMLCEYLLKNGINAITLHSDLSMAQRVSRLASYRNGDIDVLITTGVTGRGIDIPSIKFVIHYNLPRSVNDYLHRSGRTARGGGNGVVYNVIKPDEDNFWSVIKKKCFVSDEIIALPNLHFNQTKYFLDVEEFKSKEGVNGLTGGIKGKRRSKKDVLRESIEKQVGVEG